MRAHNVNHLSGIISSFNLLRLWYHVTSGVVYLRCVYITTTKHHVKFKPFLPGVSGVPGTPGGLANENHSHLFLARFFPGKNRANRHGKKRANFFGTLIARAVLRLLTHCHPGGPPRVKFFLFLQQVKNNS